MTRLEQIQKLCDFKKPEILGVEHPCRETCSGYRQGKQIGAYRENEHLMKFIVALEKENWSLIGL